MLLTLTLVTVTALVVGLAGYLIAIAWCLLDASRCVRAIADGLEAVQGHTQPVEEKLTVINGAMSALLERLRGSDSHLARAAAVFRLQ